jgi:uncharacterized protein YqjF (DUF2071 family)
MRLPFIPSRGAFLSAQWRYLLMLNYEIAPQILRPFVPAGVELDLFDGRALVSVVGFRFLRTRLLRVPIPLHRDFDEVNLRFYVRREVPGGEVRRGVAFVRELVPRAAIALVARIAYNEPYLAVPMHSTAPAGMSESPGRVEYHWTTPAGPQHVAATAVGAPAVPAPGSEAAFITEHYWGYTRQRDGGTVEYQVSHPAWRVWRVEATQFLIDVAGLYGAVFEPALREAPVSAFLAEGSAVTVHRPTRIPL